MACSARMLFAVNWVMTVLFAAFAALQFNDPDPLPWVAFYAAASLCCVLFHFSRLAPAAAGGFAVLCGVLGLLWIGWTITGQPLPGRVPGMEYEGEKEIFGFLFVGAWMAVLHYRAKRARRRP